MAQGANCHIGKTGSVLNLCGGISAVMSGGAFAVLLVMAWWTGSTDYLKLASVLAFYLGIVALLGLLSRWRDTRHSVSENDHAR